MRYDSAITANLCEIYWLVSDQLGTPRLIADRIGSLAGLKRHDSLPFGGELTLNRTAAQGYGPDSVRQGFGGYEEDSETGLDFAQARYYAATQGRFTGVDPLMASARTDQPQSFNRYTYSINNPLRYSDPSGMSFLENPHNHTFEEKAARLDAL